MSSGSKAIAIAGVTGRLGALIATYLLEKTDLFVHGLCRSLEKVEKLLAEYPDRFKAFVIDAVSPADIRKGISGCDTVVCTYNRMENRQLLDSSKALIQACDAEGVDRFIAPDYTTDYRSMDIGDLPPKDPQIEIWKYLKEGNENGTIKVKGVHILVGAFVEAFYGYFFDINNPKYWGTGDELWEFVNYESTAEYVAKVITDPIRPSGFLKCETPYFSEQKLEANL
jgi:hypothetical protein